MLQRWVRLSVWRLSFSLTRLWCFSAEIDYLSEDWVLSHPPVMLQRWVRLSVWRLSFSLTRLWCFSAEIDYLSEDWVSLSPACDASARSSRWIQHQLQHLLAWWRSCAAADAEPRAACRCEHRHRAETAADHTHSSSSGSCAAGSSQHSAGSVSICVWQDKQILLHIL